MTSERAPTERRADVDSTDGRDETVDERSDRNWVEILQELRVTQTGTQIISAFLLTVAFQQRFPKLEPRELVIYGVLVALAAGSTIMGLSVVSLHRARFRHHDKVRVVAIASRLLSVSVWIVAALTAGVVFFIFDFVFGILTGVIVGAIALVLIAWLLAVLPATLRGQQKR
jgi:cobalamin synthase